MSSKSPFTSIALLFLNGFHFVSNYVPSPLDCILNFNSLVNPALYRVTYQLLSSEQAQIWLYMDWITQPLWQTKHSIYMALCSLVLYCSCTLLRKSKGVVDKVWWQQHYVNIVYYLWVNITMASKKPMWSTFLFIAFD